MAAIVQTTRGAGPFNPTKTTLTASDTLTWVNGSAQELVLYNTTASIVNLVIDGAGGTVVPISGTGGATFSVAAGLTVAVPANGFTVVELDKIPAYLQGAVAVTAGTGVVACII